MKHILITYNLLIAIVSVLLFVPPRHCLSARSTRHTAFSTLQYCQITTNGYPNQAYCCCYSGPDGWAARHKCPFTLWAACLESLLSNLEATRLTSLTRARSFPLSAPDLKVF